MAKVGRPHYLEDPEEGPARRRQLAELVSRGTKRAEIAEAFDRHPDTISNWIHRPDVQALISQMNRERVNRIVSRVDAELEQRLERIGTMELEDVLKLRKEMVPHRVEVTERTEESEVIEELMNWFYTEIGAEPTEEDEPDDTTAERAGGVRGPSRGR